ncbi:MAG: DUF4126 domain-containing protein [Chloroflexi bacterium]|nr:DUF4126 domain-containing protein [Chloroflexota bacterium]
MSSLFGLITAFGLSTAAGLNAYIPLLIVAVLGRLEVLHLSKPYDVLTSWPVIIVLGALLLIEFTVDKIAILFASSAGVIYGIDPAIALALGLVAALGMHGAKAAVRPLVNVGTMGIGAPFMSIAEDIVSVLGTVLAVFAPLLFVVFAVLIGVAVFRVARRMRNKLVQRT